jgi:transglutaminase-like putative cysteine protease
MAHARRALGPRLAVCAGLLFPAVTTGGEDLNALLRQALQSSQPQVRGATPPLHALLARMAASDREQRERLALVARGDLPAKARARAQATLAAYEHGQGRLLTLLRAIVAAESEPTGAGAAQDLDALRAEAAELVARFELAERAEPLSSELRWRGSEITAPPLPEPATSSSSAPAPAAAVAGGDTGAPIGPIPQAIRDAASNLDGPLAVYTWVRQNVGVEFYYGVLKGPEQTLHERSGNDADIAGLLVQLLRAKGIPARYVLGTAELPSGTLRRLVGTSGTPEQAVRVLERAGIPHESVLGGGGIASVKLARIWVEAYIPYANYRGLELDAHGKAWVPLDAAFQLASAPGGIDVIRELGFDPAAAYADYLAQPRSETPLEFLRARVGALVAAQRPGTTYESVLGHRSVEPEQLGVLPNTLPYPSTVDKVAFSLPDELTHELHLVGRAGDDVVLDVRLPAADLLGGRVTIGYLPAGDEDREVIERFGGMYQTPPYLFEVRPEVRVGGVPVAAGAGAVGFGVKYALRLELKTPGGTETVDNTLLAGNMTALGLSGRETEAPPSGASGDDAGRILGRFAASYLARWNDADAELAALLRVVPVRPTLSAAFVMSSIDVEYAGGDPEYPLSYAWKGVAVDADFRPLAPVGYDEQAREAQFSLLSGLQGAVLEHRMLEDEIQVASVSTPKALALARAQGIAVLVLTRDNVEAVLPGLPFDATVKGEVREAALAGRRVTIPAAPVTLAAWTGVGYVLLDEQTGAAAYQLQGGHSGGVTAVAVNDFPPAIAAPLMAPADSMADCTTSRAFTIERISPDDFAQGIVDQRLEQGLVVLVKDRDGEPLRHACVTFRVIGGGGKLVIPVNSQESEAVTVYSNILGRASVLLKLGKHTGDLPRFLCEANRTCVPGRDEYTQVGLNVVTAQSSGATISEPFAMLGLPDTQCGGSGTCTPTVRLTTAPVQGAPNMSVAGLMAVDVKDQFQNPVSNFQVRFAYRPSPERAVPDPPWIPFRVATTSPGAVLKAADLNECLRSHANPGQGECSNESPQAIVPSSPFGAIAYAVVGDSPYSWYRFDVGSSEQPALTTASFGTWGWLCSADPALCYAEEPTTIVFHGGRYQRVNRNGNLIEATTVGSQADATMWAYAVLEDNEVRQEGSDEDGPIYRAVGKNTYKRVALTDSDLRSTPQTPGTGIDLPPFHTGGGDYRATMRLSGEPMQNRIITAAKHFPKVVRYMERHPHRVEPSTVTAGPGGGLVAERGRDDRFYWYGNIGFSTWGAKIEIDPPEPKNALLDDDGYLRHTVYFPHRILPEDWRVLLDPLQVLFTLSPSGGSPLVEATGSNGQVYAVRPGVKLTTGNLFVNIKVLNVRGDGGDVEWTTNVMDAGKGRLVLDANNDSKVDAADEELLRRTPGASFAFWQAAPWPAKDDDPAPLVDYARVRLFLPDNMDMVLNNEDLYFHMQGATLEVMPRVDSNACDGKPYLCDTAQETTQLRILHGAGGVTGVPMDNRRVRIPAVLLHPGWNEFLFSCRENCTTATTLDLERRVRGIYEPVYARAVEVRPITDWVSVYTVRNDPSFRPANGPLLTDGLDVLVSQGLGVPEKLDRVTVLMHGFNVAPQEARQGRFFPMFKRLYWAGHRMHRRQGSPERGYAHTIGIMWPGDESTCGICPNESVYYPEDEFHALESGVPVARLLGCIRPNRDGSRPQVHVVAHSLGNMTMHSALQRLGRSGVVQKYAMYDAALAAETLDRNYTPDTNENLLFSTHAGFNGYPDDIPWRAGWLTISTLPALRAFWNLQLSNMNADVQPRPTYDLRWRQVRPFEITNSAASGSTPARGDWRGFFAPNVTRTTLINAFNEEDDVTGTIWNAMQLAQKPNFFFLGLGSDTFLTQFWARIPGTDREEESIWAPYPGRQCVDTIDPPDARRHGNLLRQWAELAHWFPSRSRAISRLAQSAVSPSNNLNFTQWGDMLPHQSTASHSYLMVRKFSEVWGAYALLHGALGE